MWEFVVAFVQAFVFFILTAVFTGILTNSSAHATHDEEKGSPLTPFWPKPGDGPKIKPQPRKYKHMQILVDALNLTQTLLAQTTPPDSLKEGLSAVEVGLAAGGAAIGIGAVGAGASQAVGRNPGAIGIILAVSFAIIAVSEGTFILVAFVLKG